MSKVAAAPDRERPDFPEWDTLLLQEGKDTACADCFGGVVSQLSVVSGGMVRHVWGDMDQDLQNWERNHPSKELQQDMERQSAWSESMRAQFEAESKAREAKQAQFQAQDPPLRARWDDLQRQMDALTDQQQVLLGQIVATPAGSNEDDQARESRNAELYRQIDALRRTFDELSARQRLIEEQENALLR